MPMARDPAYFAHQIEFSDWGLGLMFQNRDKGIFFIPLYSMVPKYRIPRILKNPLTKNDSI